MHHRRRTDFDSWFSQLRAIAGERMKSPVRIDRYAQAGELFKVGLSPEEACARILGDTSKEPPAEKPPVKKENTTMSVNLGTIGNFFKSLGSKVHNALLHVFGQPALDAVEAQIKQILSDDVRVIFLDAIQSAQTLQVGVGEASGPEKRIAAFNKISTDLKTKGVSLGEAAINLGIELCVNLLKAKQP